jgi:hypothetical protein
MEQRRSKSIIQEKSFRFAVDIVEYARRHQKDDINLVLTRQLQRSGTSIGANVEEALGGQSRKDFIAMRLIRETRPHNIQALPCLLTECDALKTILNSIILTTRNTLATQHSEPRTQNSNPRTHNLEPRTQNPELRGN